MRISAVTVWLVGSALALPQPQESDDRRVATDDHRSGFWNDLTLYGSGILTGVGGVLAFKPKASASAAPGIRRPVALQKTLDTLLPTVRLMLNGPFDEHRRMHSDGVDWPLTDQEVMDWMRCVTDNGGALKGSEMSIPTDVFEDCWKFIQVNRKSYHDAGGVRHTAAGGRRHEPPAQANEDPNAFSLQRPSLGALTTLGHQAKQRVAEIGGAMSPHLSSWRSKTADGKFWQQAATNLAGVASGTIARGATAPKMVPAMR